MAMRSCVYLRWTEGWRLLLSKIPVSVFGKPLSYVNWQVGTGYGWACFEHEYPMAYGVAYVNSAVIDVNKDSLKKRTPQLKCWGSTKFCSPHIKAKVGKKAHSCFCPRVACLSCISVEMCLAEASDINFLIL